MNVTLTELQSAVVIRKRDFFSSKKYQHVNEMIADARRPGLAAWYVGMALDLRRVKKNRHTLQELHSGKGRWQSAFRHSLWVLYVAEYNLYARAADGIRDAPGLERLSRRMRSHLIGTGMVRPRRVSDSKLAAINLNDLSMRVRNLRTVIWMDNFNKLRFAHNPNEERDRSINATVLALLPTSFAKREVCWTGVKELCSLVHTCIDSIMSDVGKVWDDMRSMDLYDVSFDNIRVPCDLRRLGVHPVQWHPFGIEKNNISTSDGLILDLMHMQDVVKKLHVRVTLLLDINVYYRIMKLVYSVTFVQFNLRAALRDIDMVFGVWHAYAHCVKRMRLVFFPWWCCLEYTTMLDDPEETMVYLFPKVLTMEMIVAGLYCIRSRVRPVLQRLVAQCEVDHGQSHVVTINAKMLQLFLLGYVPFIFNLGTTVRTT